MPSLTFISPSGKSSAEDLAKIAYKTIHQGTPVPKQQQEPKRRLWVTLPNGRRASVLTRKNYRYAVVASAGHCTKAASYFLEGERVKAQRRANYYTKRPNTGGQFVVLTVDEGEGV
jgi:hypothetical protein